LRKSWIAVALIALVVGIAAGYRAARFGNPQRVPVRSERAAEAPPTESRSEADAHPPPAAPSAPESSVGQGGGRPQTRDDESRSTRALKNEMPSEPRDAASAIGGPAGVATRQAADAHLASDAVPGSAAQPVATTSAPPAAPPISPAASSPVHPPVPSNAPAASGPPLDDPAKKDAATAPADDPESDRHPPVLAYLRFDPPEIRDGNLATLSVGATDDLSGVKFVFGTVRSPSEAAIIPFTAQDEAGTGVFTTRIAIPRQAETGDWFVGSLQIVDKADNPLNLAFAKATVPAGGSLRVTSDDSDSVAPTVHRVSVDKATVAAGEKVQILVDVDDDRSGVASVTGTFQSPTKSAFVPFGCRDNGDSTWVGDVSIPASANCGEWTLGQLRVADKANNTAYLTSDAPEVGTVAFVVTGGGGCDSEPPVVDGVSVSPAVVSNAAASEVVLSFTIHDDGSGVGSLSGRIEGPVSATGQVPKIFFAWASDPQHPDAPITTKIPVPQFAARGTWSIVLVQVMDKARNTRTYNKNDPALAGGSFTVE
jgi:hypothetical protein